MKKFIVLSIMLLIAFSTILTGCNLNKKSNITEKSEQITEKSFLPENVPNFIGKTYTALKKEKGIGKENYIEYNSKKQLSFVQYDEKWFELDKNLKASYLISDDDKTISGIILEFPKETNRNELAKHLSKYLGEKREYASGECSSYHAEWKKDGFIYSLEDFGYLEMYINKDQ
ncbi:hypothetical protein FQB35_00420 [Crassaminicella thermophila]|uniref:Lipoprotein n=1 Tax=Crassaminicella thermophila TaxID=2599308 RepID=A0A5C0SB87_CRATE|nr:hypothetical protein [Crassaminicella thermophila]QEK10956.1 hypothetical protein FQB35_00420 [Crassaminicella thermophila]